MPRGYCGKILRVDLSLEVVKDEPIPESLYKNYLGGPGLASRILFDEVPPHISPFDPVNRLIFMTGLLTGTGVLAGARYAVVCKSPQTMGYGEATAGGKWASELKQAGYDGIVIQGCAKTPKYLLVSKDQVEIRKANHLWEKDTLQTEELLQQELGLDKEAKTLYGI